MLFPSANIIEQVSVESVEIVEGEGLEVSLADVLESSISEFNVLRPSIPYFLDLKEAVCQSLTNVYSKMESMVWIGL